MSKQGSPVATGGGISFPQLVELALYAINSPNHTYFFILKKGQVYFHHEFDIPDPSIEMAHKRLPFKQARQDYEMTVSINQVTISILDVTVCI